MKDVQLFVNSLSRKKVSRSGKGKKEELMQPAGIRFTFDILRRICEVAYLNQIIDRNPCNKLISMPKLPEKRERVLEVEEAGRVLESAPEALKLPVFCALLLGMRLGEVAGLQWSDLDRVKRTLTIRRQIDHKGNVTNLKTSSSKRTLILPQEFIDFIDKYGDLDQESISPLNRRSIEYAWYHWEGKPNGWTFHDLRHGAAGLIEATGGGNVLGSQAVLGHASPDMTNVYLGRNAELTRAALSGLTSVLTSKKEDI